MLKYYSKGTFFPAASDTCILYVTIFLLSFNAALVNIAVHLDAAGKTYLYKILRSKIKHQILLIIEMVMILA